MSLNNKKAKIFGYVVIELFFLTACLAAYSLPWALRNYPMQSNTTVFFVLTADTSGHDSGTFLSALMGFIIPGVITYLIVNAVLITLRKFNILKSLKIFNYIKIGYVVIQVLAIVIVLKAWNYPVIACQISKTPVESEFYKTNMIDSRSAKITAPENKRNLVVIFMESMESSYADIENGGVFEENLIPNISRLARENVNFSDTEKIGGGINLEGTSWTVAGLLSKLFGLPYYNPFVNAKDSNGKKFVECLPSAVSLTDVLAENGYKDRCVFAMGSEKQFENRDSLLDQHNFEVHDINWYKDKGYIEKDYRVFWGFEDQKLFDIAKKELAEIASDTSKPFAYGMLTVDTHYPHGFKCERCSETNSNFEEPIMNVIRCADNMVNDFIEWMKTQKWYENTTVVILGDHCFLDAPLNNFLYRNSPLTKDEVKAKRRFMNLIINPAPEVDVSNSVQKNRMYSSFDVMPTVLEAMGYKIENGGLAFGRSLFSGEKTMVELYSQEELQDQLLTRTVEYEALKKKPE